MRIHTFVSAIFVVSLATLGCAATKGRAFAGSSACLEQPDQDSPQGEHWYFHLDREKNRKCWHLGPAPAGAFVHEAAPTRMERSRSFAGPVEAAFSSLVSGFRSLFRRPMPHEAQAGEPRIIQSDATRPLTMEDIVQLQPELPEDRAEARAGLTGSLAPTHRKALHEDHLRWEELQRAGGASPLAPLR